MSFADFNALLEHLKPLLQKEVDDAYGYTETIEVSDFDHVHTALSKGIDSAFEDVVCESSLDDSRYNSLRGEINDLLSKQSGLIEEFAEAHGYDESHVKEDLEEKLSSFAYEEIDFTHLHDVELNFGKEYDATIHVGSVCNDDDWCLHEELDDADALTCLERNLGDMATFLMNIGVHPGRLIADLRAELARQTSPDAVQDTAERIDEFEETLNRFLALPENVSRRHANGVTLSAEALSKLLEDAGTTDIVARFIIDGDLIKEAAERISYGGSDMISSEIELNGLFLTGEYDGYLTLPGKFVIDAGELPRAINNPSAGGAWHEANYAGYRHQALYDQYTGRFDEAGKVKPDYTPDLCTLGQWLGESRHTLSSFIKAPWPGCDVAAKTDEYTSYAETKRTAIEAALQRVYADEASRDSAVLDQSIVLRGETYTGKDLVRWLDIEGWMLRCEREFPGMADEYFAAEIMTGQPNEAAVMAFVAVYERNRAADLMPMAKWLISYNQVDCLRHLLPHMDVSDESVYRELLLASLAVKEYGSFRGACFDGLLAVEGAPAPKADIAYALIKDKYSGFDDEWLLQQLGKLIRRGCEPVDRADHKFGITRLLETKKWNSNPHEVVSKLTEIWLETQVQQVPKPAASAPRVRL